MNNKSAVKTNRHRLKMNTIKAIEAYNKYRFPEAFAKLIDIKEDEIVVKFEGTFCNTCGVIDWIEDLVYILMEHGLNAKLIEYIESPTNNDYYRIGIFKIKNIHGNSYKGGSIGHN